MLKVSNVKKAFGVDEILKDVTFSIDKGEVVAILGPSGAGKTTFLRSIAFLEKVNSGIIDFDGEVCDMTTATRKDIAKIRQEMGFVFQSFNLFNNLTALENVCEGLITARKMKKAEAVEIAMENLKWVGLFDKANFYPDQLSGGQQQRVAIARALALNPKVILLDEPTSALDPELTKEVLEVIKRMAKGGQTMIIVTHEMSFAREVAGRIIFMEDGTIIEDSPSEVFFTNPKEERSRNFVQKIS